MRIKRSRITRWVSELAAGLVTVPAMAQAPVPPTGPAPIETTRPAGPLRRALHHVGFTLKDKFIGYPDQFVEPPLGFYVYETMGLMKARADTHDFMLYRSDFLDGGDALSPGGAQRLTVMAARLPGWLGPVYVEWTPDHPGLADSRKATVVALLQKSGLPIVPERVVVGPSPYPGLMGADANNNFGILIMRDKTAPENYSLTPNPSTPSFGGGGTR